MVSILLPLSLGLIAITGAFVCLFKSWKYQDLANQEEAERTFQIINLDHQSKISTAIPIEERLTRMAVQRSEPVELRLERAFQGYVQAVCRAGSLLIRTKVATLRDVVEEYQQVSQVLTSPTVAMQPDQDTLLPFISLEDALATCNAEDRALIQCGLSDRAAFFDKGDTSDMQIYVKIVTRQGQRQALFSLKRQAQE